MGIDEVLGDKRLEILELAQKYGISNVRVFGSVARGEAGADSDVDLLVDVRPGVGLVFGAKPRPAVLEPSLLIC